MSISQKTIHDIPLLWRPFHDVISYFLAFLLWSNYKIRRSTSRIVYINQEVIAGAENYILCLWHEDLNLFFITHPYFHDRHIAMTYPLWYMKPVHIFKKWIGFRELAYGASGIDGKEALHQVMDRLREGWSTFIAPDGPKGPAKMIKKGVLEMSLKTATPIVPISFQVTRERRDKNWDKKRIPLVGAKIRVSYGSPIYVTADNYEESKILIGQCMSGFKTNPPPQAPPIQRGTIQ